MTDLFSKKKTKKEELKEWLLKHNMVKSSEVLKWQVSHFCNRADRYCRELAQEGFLRRIDEERKQNIFGGIREDVWEIIN